MNWLHFVGRAYYTEQSFIKEAKAVGVTRRLSLRQLKQMEFGDTVWLAINDGKSAVMLGKFVIDSIHGLPGGVAAECGLDLEKVDDGGMMISRGCGSYMTGATYVIKGDAKLSELAAAAEKLDPKCKPMVGGKFLDVERVRLKSMRGHQGFRRFDHERYLAAMHAANKARPVVKGHFYADRDTTSNVVSLDERRLVETKGYKRK